MSSNRLGPSSTMSDSPHYERHNFQNIFQDSLWSFEDPIQLYQRREGPLHYGDTYVTVPQLGLSCHQSSSTCYWWVISRWTFGSLRESSSALGILLMSTTWLANWGILLMISSSWSSSVVIQFLDEPLWAAFRDLFYHLPLIDN